MTAYSDEIQKCDILIVGGGLVGASMAASLSSTELNVVVIEAISLDSTSQPSYDERTVALTYSARNIFQGIGVWDQLSLSDIQPIKDIHISNKGHFGITHLNHLHAGTDALGYVIPTRVLGKTLHHAINNNKQCQLICPAVVENIDYHNHNAVVSIRHQHTLKQIQTSLVIIADGGRSNITTPSNRTATRAKQENTNQGKQYNQVAMLSIVSVDRPHQGRAYERFTPEGPLALLPLTDQRYAVVWTLSPERSQTLQTLTDAHYLDALAMEFGDRAGCFSLPSARKCYPLSHHILADPISDRTVTIGNAAHTVHPVAGQGFNLGLRDVATLAEGINHCIENGIDIADRHQLDAYRSSRERDTRHVSQFTDGLIRIFSHESVLLGLARNIGLKSIEHLPGIKRLLLHKTMGISGRQPRLVRGLPLQEKAL